MRTSTEDRKQDAGEIGRRGRRKEPPDKEALCARGKIFQGAIMIAFDLVAPTSERLPSDWLAGRRAVEVFLDDTLECRRRRHRCHRHFILRVIGA